jgi:adenylate cyclase
MPAVTIDFEREGLLKGTRGKGREARRQLLEELADDGVSLEELRRAVREDRLALLPVERFLDGGGPRYTFEQVAGEAGVDVGFLIRNRQSLGLPAPEADEVAATDADLETAKRIRTLLDAGVPEDGVVENSRVLGLAVSNVAASATALVGEAMLRPGDTELEAAHRYLEATRTLQPMLGPAVVYALNLHLREQIRQAAVGSAELAEGRLAGTREVTACFADLVGFTRLGETLEFDALARVTTRLGELAREVARGPVQLVKMIGDAAMMVSPENDALLDSALELIEAVDAEGEDFPQVRAGLARGDAVARGGDWYGRPVNLASRITSIAYPASALCSKSVRDAAGEGFRWSLAGDRRLKGIDGRVRLFRARRDRDGDA